MAKKSTTKSTTKKTPVVKKQVNKKTNSKSKVLDNEVLMMIQTTSGETFVGSKKDFVKGDHPDHMFGGYYIEKSAKVSLNTDLPGLNIDTNRIFRIFIPINNIDYIGETI
jgi:hypothetical protein